MKKMTVLTTFTTISNNRHCKMHKCVLCIVHKGFNTCRMSGCNACCGFRNMRTSVARASIRKH